MIYRDGGYAWVVLGAATVAVALTGLTFCNGIFNVVFLETFGQDKATTAWCGSIQSGSLNICGLLASVLTRHIGVRRTVFLGSALATVGWFGCYFADSFWVVFIFYGFFVGIGFGLIYAPAIVITGFYFEKYRNAAYGVVTTGAGIGTMVYAPLLEKLMENFTWREATLIISGIVANGFVVGALMRPVEMGVSEEKDIVCSDENDRNVLIPDSEKFPGDGLGYSTHMPHKESMLKSVLSLASSTASKISVAQSLRHMVSMPNEAFGITNVCNHVAARECEENAESSEEVEDGSLKKFLSLPYIAFMINLVLINCGISVTFLHFPAYVTLHGFSSQTVSFLLTMMGFGNIIGRLGSGMLTNAIPGHLMFVYNTSCILTGIVILTAPIICKTFIGQVAFSILFSGFGNCYCALMGPVCIQIAGLGGLSFGYGLAIVACGVGFLSAPPFAGWLFDISGSYIYTFVFAGTSFALGGFLMAASYVMGKCSRN